MKTPSLEFIGVIHSPLKTLGDCPLQEHENAPHATVSVYANFSEGVKDLKAGDEILLLTWLHQADRSVIKCIPRREFESPQLGVFSTRSPDRPNPIGLHKTKVISKTEDGRIEVSQLEVLDGTPLIDIKPVI